jgi:hypothetical protein
MSFARTRAANADPILSHFTVDWIVRRPDCRAASVGAHSRQSRPWKQDLLPPSASFLKGDRQSSDGACAVQVVDDPRSRDGRGD